MQITDNGDFQNFVAHKHYLQNYLKQIAIAREQAYCYPYTGCPFEDCPSHISNYDKSLGKPIKALYMSCDRYYRLCVQAYNATIDWLNNKHQENKRTIL